MRPIQSAALAMALGFSLTACGAKSTSDADSNDNETGAPKPAAGLTQGTFVDRVFGAITKSGSAKVSFDADNGEEKPRGDGEVKYGDTLAMRINLNPGYGNADDTSDVLLVGDTMYARGNGKDNRPADGKYGATDLHALESMGMPDIIGFLDPRPKADAFDAAVTGFKQAGAAETLDGVEATPYAITIDKSKAGSAYEGMAGDVLHFTFYIGPDDLPRKLAYRDQYSSFTANYSNWGTPVDIKAPPAAEVDRLPSAPH